MCKWGTCQTIMLRGRLVDIDDCIVEIVKALNIAGSPTRASCCGHGRRPGNIMLEDGRELVIAPDYQTARIVDAAFPPIFNEKEPAHAD